jgi:hypothetical protein
VYGHDGNTIGQSSKLRIVPDAGVAMCLLTNGGEAEQVYRALFGDVLDELAGVAMPSPLEAPATPPDVELEPLAGTYERLSIRYELAADDGHLSGTVTVSGPLAELVPDPVTKVTLTPVDAVTFLVQEEGSETPAPAVFYEFEDGVPHYLHSGARANRRVRA